VKVSKKQLRRLIKEEKRKLLKEGGGVGIGFSNWSANKNPDFAKAYGKDARVLRDFGSNSARQSRLHEADLQNAESKADSALVELLDEYLDQHLDLSGSNRRDALDLAYQDLLDFCDGVIQMSKEAEASEDGWTEEDEMAYASGRPWEHN
jgi:hypothetical protein